MLCALVQTIGAQQEKELSFTSLDWNEMQIDSVLPVYTEVVPLESDYRTHSYTVSLLYPEYAALSAKESLVAERFDSLLNETIDVETFVGVERRRGLLDISFIPIRRKDGKYEKVWDCPFKTEMAHSIWAREIYGKNVAIIGHRKGESRDLIEFYFEDGEYKTNVLAKDVGSANIYPFDENGKVKLVSTNREINEIAFYEVEE